MELAVLLFTLATVPILADPSVVHPELWSSLEKKGAITALISFKNSRHAQVRDRAASQKYPHRAARLHGIYSALKSHADDTQFSTLALLYTLQATTSRNIKVRQLWISNQVVVRGADDSVIKQLMAMNVISEIREEVNIPHEKPVETTAHPEGYAPKEAVQWGVAKIQAPAVWASGNRGQGVVVATIDTGVRGTHAALQGQLRPKYNWFDPYNFTKTPNDCAGHGTHTMGTIVGNLHGIGVAPAAQWIACRGCGERGCSEAALVECGQWVACPTLPDGSNCNCTYAPDVVSNSWGGGQGQHFYDEVLLAWNAFGIASVFSAGNSGPNCRTANSPADSTFALSVAATDINDTVAFFSSRGPTVEGNRIKPDLAAPGFGVFSSYYTSDNAYATLSGTSMAAPHVCGLVALLIRENSSISIKHIEGALIAGAQPTNPTGKNCGNISEASYPNNMVGAGRISAPASIKVVEKNQCIFLN